MRSATLPAILLAALVTACSSDAPTATRATPTAAQLAVGANNTQRTQSIEGLVAAVEAAANAGDAAAYASAFSEDVEVITLPGAIISGRAAYHAYSEAFFGGPFAGVDYDLTLRRVAFLTGTIAVVDLDLEVSGYTSLPPGLQETEPGVLCGRARWLVVKRGGAWQIVAVQFTPITPGSGIAM
jgi:uncharacterized protein (TIGR02246 family)